MLPSTNNEIDFDPLGLVTCWHSQNLQIGFVGNKTPTFSESTEKSVFSNLSGNENAFSHISDNLEKSETLATEYTKSIHDSFNLNNSNMSSLFNGEIFIF